MYSNACCSVGFCDLLAGDRPVLDLRIHPAQDEVSSSAPPSAGFAGTSPASGEGVSVLGAGAGASGVAVTPSAPISTTAISAPAWTVSPSFARISRRIPDTGAGTSALTLSVSTSSIGSNSTTLSPGLSSHLEIVPSWTDSPSCGMTTRVVVAISTRRDPSGLW